jgi:hypoxanthine phosphoribosyltransferase
LTPNIFGIIFSNFPHEHGAFSNSNSQEKSEPPINSVHSCIPSYQNMSQNIKILDKSFQPYISAEVIQARIKEIASQIQSDYEGKEVWLIGILNGAFRFLGDLTRELHLPTRFRFIRVSSYQGLASTGQVNELMGLDISIENKHLIIVEDIVDTGLTLHHLMSALQSQSPASLEIATLLHKPECLQFEIALKYVGFEIPNRFVVGYGLDYEECGRELNDIYQLALQDSSI